MKKHDSMFVHLNCHSDYSLYESTATINGLVEEAKHKGMEGLALTDLGNMSGVIEFYRTCKSFELNPIIGTEAYISDSAGTETSRIKGNCPNSRVILLARNDTGLRNLIRLYDGVNEADSWGRTFVNPDFERSNREGIICIVPTVNGGERGQNWLVDLRKKRNYFGMLAEHFDEGHFYFGLKDHGYVTDQADNEEAMALSESMNLPLVAFNDVRYLHRVDAEAQRVLHEMGQAKAEAVERFPALSGTEHYFKNGEAMEQIFGHIQGAIGNTAMINSMVSLERWWPAPQAPIYPIPKGFRDATSYLRHLVMKGLENRNLHHSRNAINRTYFELESIAALGLEDFFLMLWDMVSWARARGIAIGPGRGIAPSFLVNYALGITDIDPLRFGLLVEPFLDVRKPKYPNFQFDFGFERRHEVLQYLSDKYGEDHACTIAEYPDFTFSEALKNCAAMLEIPAKTERWVCQWAKKFELGEGSTAQELRILVKMLAHGESLPLLAVANGIAKRKQGLAPGPRVAINAYELSAMAPCLKLPSGACVAIPCGDALQPDSATGELQIFGFRTLDRIQSALGCLEPDSHVRLSSPCPEWDLATEELLGSGDTEGVFMLGKPDMRELLKEFRPTSFNDLVLLVAISGQLTQEIRGYLASAKASSEMGMLMDSWLREILGESYGMVAYHEQGMRILHEGLGMPLDQADRLSRRFAWGTVGEPDLDGEKVLHLAQEKGLELAQGKDLLRLLRARIPIPVSKGNALAYSRISWQAAFLKANHRNLFLEVFGDLDGDEPESARWS